MRILLIEDDSTLSASIAKHLRSESFAVDIAGDGAKGEEFAQVNEYDVILLDIHAAASGWVERHAKTFAVHRCSHRF